LQQIHFIAIAIKLVTKIVSDAFEILLPTQLFQYLDMKFNFSKQHTKKYKNQETFKGIADDFRNKFYSNCYKVDLLQGFLKLKKIPLNLFNIS
jgi:hypothetical protein